MNVEKGVRGRMRLHVLVKTALVLVGIVATIATALALRLYSVESNLSQNLASSSVVRWWRCRGVEHPLLTSGRGRWTLTYSWSEGFGPGDVTLELTSEGHAKLISSERGQPSPQTTDYEIPQEEITRIATVVDSSGLLCQMVHLREGYFVFDLGKFSVDVGSDNYSRSVFVDGCHTIPDPTALFDIRAALIGLQPSLPDSISWGPEGTASVPTDQDACSDRARPNPLGGP
jgi:hypothetical protein